MSGQWASSNRRSELPANWHWLRGHVRKRDKGVCQWPVGDSICGKPGDGGVDHKNDPHDHRPENLWLLCAGHHKHKTQAEAMAGRVFAKRPAEKHPGLL